MWGVIVSNLSRVFNETDSLLLVLYLTFISQNNGSCADIHSDNSMKLHMSTSIYSIPLHSLSLSPSVLLFLFLPLLCSDLPGSLILARIRSKDLTPETQLPHRAKCAAHNLQYPSKVLHTLSKPLSLWCFRPFALHYSYILFTHSACLFSFHSFASPSLPCSSSPTCCKWWEKRKRTLIFF